MLATLPDARTHTILRTLCVVIFVTMVIAVVYAAWIGIANFSRIRV